MFPLTNKLSVIPTAPSEAVSTFCKNDEVSAWICDTSEPVAKALVSVVTFVNCAPSPTKTPKDAVEFIEPLTPPPRVKSSLPENNPKKEPLTLVASTPAVTPDNWEPSPIYAPNESVDLI